MSEFRMVSLGLKTLLNLILMTSPWCLFCSWDGCILPYPWSVFRDKQFTLVNTIGVPGDAGSSPGKSRGGMPKYDPTTKLIILRRSPKTSCTLRLLWPKFTHKYCIQKEIIKYKCKVPVNKKNLWLRSASSLESLGSVLFIKTSWKSMHIAQRSNCKSPIFETRGLFFPGYIKHKISKELDERNGR